METETKVMKTITILVREYLYQKKRKIKRTQNMKNSLLKVQQMYKEKFHNVIRSKDLTHLDNLIEEYIGINEINNWLLFSHERMEQEKTTEHPNNEAIACLAFNQRLLNSDLKAAIDREVQDYDNFHLVKIHHIHLCNQEFKKF